ncbi:DNA polymerase delta small subunit Cdc1 [Linderina pennispora]|nr:DNA polymerase delta small subunit Cdc1 [Linderina pennispora]
MLADSTAQRVFSRVEATTGTLPEHSGAFRIGHRSYIQQFAKFYSVRLDALKPLVLASAQKKWSSRASCTAKVLNVERSQLTYIAGTVFIESAGKPSTLVQVAKEHWITDTPEKEVRSAESQVLLEDESGRIQLVGKFVDGSVFVSGTVMAALGRETSGGEFEVIDVCYAGMPPQPPRPKSDKVVAFVSGLNVTSEQPVTLEMQALAEYLCGCAGSSEMQENVSRIAQVVVAGNLVDMPPAPVGHAEDSKANDRAPMQQLVGQLDEYLADIAASVPLTLMPGKHDPTDLALPQQPVHPSMFPKSLQYSTFRSTTNPGWLHVDGTSMLGTGGQNIDDIAQYALNDVTKCQMAAKSLSWRHIAPSAPDTLWCYPFTDSDPFILTETPHVYFIGSQDEFEAKIAEGREGQKTAVVMVPDFSKTAEIVLLNLATLQCTTVQFSVGV